LPRLQTSLEPGSILACRRTPSAAYWTRDQASLIPRRMHYPKSPFGLLRHRIPATGATRADRTGGRARFVCENARHFGPIRRPMSSDWTSPSGRCFPTLATALVDAYYFRASICWPKSSRVPGDCGSKFGDPALCRYARPVVHFHSPWNFFYRCFIPKCSSSGKSMSRACAR
jgi:hypothetical protein